MDDGRVEILAQLVSHDLELFEVLKTGDGCRNELNLVVLQVQLGLRGLLFLNSGSWRSLK